MHEQIILINLVLLIILAGFSLLLYWQSRYSRKETTLANQSIQRELTILQERWQQFEKLREFIERIMQEQRDYQHAQREKFDQHQIKSLSLIQETLNQGLDQVRQQVTQALNQQSDSLSKRVDQLTQQTGDHLRHISTQVGQTLNEGFEKTQSIFSDVIKRLTIIDQAQQKITELSGNVVSLQEILQDKRARGAFGETQLAALIRNMLPEQHFKLQYELSNQTRVDCMLFLPEPTGNVAIDAKFPLESYRKINSSGLSMAEIKQAKTQFKQDIRKHIRDIATKYIIAGETADGAVMFIPAEAIFADIHSHYPELVEEAFNARVWLVSPTTMMAILTTARAVLKDAATRQQIHIIQEHLVALGKDFNRFQGRMDNLAKHIGQAQQDVELAQKSSQKITNRFAKIEKVELAVESKLESCLPEEV